MHYERKAVAVGLLLLLQHVWAAPQGTKVVRAAAEPANFTANPSIGGGGTVFKDSAHFRLYNNTGSEESTDIALAHLEASYDCYIVGLGYRSTGLSYYDEDDTGPWTKTNVYYSPDIDAGGLMNTDWETGLGWLQINPNYITDAGYLSHEYGHIVTHSQKKWVDQDNTSAWWETWANWFADTYKTSDICAAARAAHGRPVDKTEFYPDVTVGNSHLPIVVAGTNGNLYRAWPFMTYLTTNLDNIPDAGLDIMRQINIQYRSGSGETPLHTLQRILGPIGPIVGRYWARMAYVDIDNPVAREYFWQKYSTLIFDNIDQTGNGSYTVKPARRPGYMGASMIPLNVTSSKISVDLTANGTYTASLALFNGKTNATRYVDVVETATTSVSADEAVTLVVANTPEELITYNGYEPIPELYYGLDFTFQLSGATA
ncbi:unnamed protein product [Clonostachys rosea]|uniref:Uncharacterized protein n=1 Tax=Bionectria ochroleuca TaxID=29856 RepID=A0ABY6V2D6_BIOOC|nr:unnamed protein product [Clonostachys rosea]